MPTHPATYSTIDEYIAGFPKDVQEILKNIRATIHAAAPQAQETIKYKMPTFLLHGNLVYFSAFKKHIGFYPGSKEVRQHFAALSAYAGQAGSLQFPLDRPIPYDLIGEIVKFRAKENLERVAAKRKQE